MNLWYRIAADVIVVVHAGYVLFVVVGLLLILMGLWRRWEWVRNVWFRIIHLVMIGVVVAEAWIGIVCPLTTWEKQLRELAGQSTYRDAFLANLVHQLLFFDAPHWVFTCCYTLFALAVLVMFIAIPPRRPFRSRN